MKYHLVIPKKVQKEIDRIDEKYKVRLLLALKLLEEDPFAGKKLEGEYRGQWSYRVWPYRIIYEIIKNELVVLVVHVGHRQGAY